MTNWSPELTRNGSPLYREIADLLARDITEDRLPAGTRLPTHRDLAWRLKVTVGTVSRAYAEAERRGLIGGEVGRGTFVLPTQREWAPPRPPAEPDKPDSGFIDLSVNYAITGSEAGALSAALTRLSGRNDLSQLLRYQPHAGIAADREAAAKWLRSTGLTTAHADSTVLTNGGQHALAALLFALTRPGDAVAVEHLTYPGFKAAAQHVGVHLVGVATDEAGLRPDALDSACRTRTIRALYVLPTLHNPTTITMPEERRREIAEVCRRHELPVIEDDVYAFLKDPPFRPLSDQLPELGFFLSSASKSFAPGLRIGYIHAPRRDIERVAAAIRASTYMATPLMAAIATQWIGDGTAERMMAEKRQLAAARHTLLWNALGDGRFGTELMTDPVSLHSWLTLPPGWRAEEFAAVVRQRGVGVTPAAAFAVGATCPEAIRVCLGTPETAADLERGLSILTTTLAARPSHYLSVV
jgi:DNA-binding transcriptional MocR family regulator